MSRAELEDSRSELEASSVGSLASKDWLQSKRKVERQAESIESSFKTLDVNFGKG